MREEKHCCLDFSRSYYYYYIIIVSVCVNCLSSSIYEKIKMFNVIFKENEKIKMRPLYYIYWNWKYKKNEKF